MSIHYSKELWGPIDPYKFYPLRHAPEHKRNPLAFTAFGIGARNCIGMKFALMNLRLTLVKIIRNFYILKSDKTHDVIYEFVETLTRWPKNGVHVTFQTRNHN